MQPIRDSFRDHISDDLLEACAVGRLAEADRAYVEEHLLVCEQCRERLVAMESFVSELKTALEAGEHRPPRLRSACAGGATEA
jgi:anti-sigma factor RsiW